MSTSFFFFEISLELRANKNRKQKANRDPTFPPKKRGSGRSAGLIIAEV
jgi:hypothetical protein